MKQGLQSSINAAYTKNEILSLLKESNLKSYKVTETQFGLSISGKKWVKSTTVTLQLKLEKRHHKLRWFKTHERSLSYDAKEIFS